MEHHTPVEPEDKPEVENASVFLEEFAHLEQRNKKKKRSPPWANPQDARVPVFVNRRQVGASI